MLSLPKSNNDKSKISNTKVALIKLYWNGESKPTAPTTKIMEMYKMLPLSVVLELGSIVQL